MKQIFLFIILSSLLSTIKAQSYKDWDDYNVDEFYVKKDLKYGTLDENGEEISFVFITTDLKQGTYEVEIADYENDLYQIKGTDYYVKFRGYYGYAGYGDEGILEVGSSAYSSTFYKKP